MLAHGAGAADIMGVFAEGALGDGHYVVTWWGIVMNRVAVVDGRPNLS